MRSSYQENNYGLLFTALSTIEKPQLIVECGVLDGYSLIALAKGAPEGCRVVGYDLFEDYEFKHGTQNEIMLEAQKSGVADKIALIKGDAILGALNYADEQVDILHIDISNDGDNLRAMFDAWSKKIKSGGLVIFEGGSVQRDQIEWMVKYHKASIREFKFDLREYGFEYVTLLPFPSLTICRKRIFV